MTNGSESKEHREDQPVIKMTRKEFDWARNADPDDPKLIEFMSEKGIAFDQGDLDTLIDDIPMRITTAKHDFGTVVVRRNAA